MKLLMVFGININCHRSVVTDNKYATGFAFIIRSACHPQL